MRRIHIITNVCVEPYFRTDIEKCFRGVTNELQITAKLEIKIFTGKNAEKWLKKLTTRHRSRMGVTSKKMVEKYENDVKGSK